MVLKNQNTHRALGNFILYFSLLLLNLRIMRMKAKKNSKPMRVLDLSCMLRLTKSFKLTIDEVFLMFKFMWESF